MEEKSLRAAEELIESFKLRFVDDHVRVVPREGRPYDLVGVKAQSVFEVGAPWITILEGKAGRPLRALSVRIDAGMVRYTWGAKGAIGVDAVVGLEFQRELRPKLVPALWLLADLRPG